jgi:hypothetical protein
MHNINVYKAYDGANIEQLPVKRDWMDRTVDSHAYRCFPVTLTNSLGWGISFPEDITFVWDGISDTRGDHVKILQGKKYCYTERANATISFKTGLTFRTNENITLLQMPVPNMFIDGAQPFTTLMSTSFFGGELPCAWRITKPHLPITIKANTPVISIIPISLGELQNSELVINDIKDLPPIKTEEEYNEIEHLKITKKILEQGKWTNFYRDAVDYKGNKLGSHEVKNIKLKTINRIDNA